MDKSVGFYFGEEELDTFFDDDAVSAESMDSMTANDAYVLSMRMKGHVDLAYMQAISGMTCDELIDSLIGKAILPDPEAYAVTEDYYGCFTSRQQYLKGNLIKKYKRAQSLNKEYGGLFDETLKLLKSNLPDAVDPEDIHMNLGSTWIPVMYITDFVRSLLSMRVAPLIEYNEFLGNWTMQIVSAPDYVKNKYLYGTSRMDAVTIIKHILNARPVKVYDRVPRIDGKKGVEYVLNQAETLTAQTMEKKIQQEWQDYVHGDDRRERHLQEAYMDSYGYALCRYDGSFLELPDLNPDVKPYKHQLDAIARIVLNNNTLLAHEVGAGKTLEYICGIHELLRMGLGKKAMIVVPNSTFSATVEAYRHFYEMEKILPVCPKKDFTPAERSKTLRKIKSEEYRVIIMSYSSFDMISLTGEYAITTKEAQLRDCIEQRKKAKHYVTVQALKAEMERLEKALAKLREQICYGETACFDELGIDILVVDEAHTYKNITIDKMTGNIVGVHSCGSKKADNMLEKVRYIQDVGGHVIFATGTPITNSMADLYVLQKYLQPNELALCHVSHFNDWINTFASQTHSFEIDVDSRNFRYTTRFSKFHNLPELMSMFSNVCDFYRIATGDLGLPGFDGYTDVVVKKSAAQRAYTDILVERTEQIRAHLVKKSEDNLLLITVDGRKCALDMRLVDSMATMQQDETKVMVCARNMADIYISYPNTTQIAFCDISTPRDGFNIYDELSSELIKQGIPAAEIVFIHEAKTEAQRRKIEDRFNKGEIRILIGSTMKLGTGANVQERLVAVHHLDVPWRPADMVQREGRIIRQGNTNEKVFVYRYCTEASFDAYTWQILENKQRFIAQFLSGSLSGVHRDESDCADTVLEYAEIKALAIGNPLIKERVEVANELEHAKINLRQKRKQLLNLQELLATMPKKIEHRIELLRCANMDAVAYVKDKKPVSKEERLMFGEELLYALSQNVMVDKEREFDTFQGFAVILPKHMKPEKAYVLLRRPNSNTYSVKMDGDKPLGCSQSIEYFLNHLGDVVSGHEQALEELYKQKQHAEHTIELGNEFEAEVEALVVKLREIDCRLNEGG